MNFKTKLFAEFLGSAGLLMVVVGSGIMGETLSPGNPGITLLANSIATGAGLYVLITCFHPISGAHFNPLVSAFEAMSRKLSVKEFLLYSAAQVAGAILGVLLTHLMFNKDLIQFSTQSRVGAHLMLSEFIATVGLICTIKLTSQENSKSTPTAVALYITAAYWFTSSTSFSNPAVSIARAFTNTFTGIAWVGVPGFILAQAVGLASAYFLTTKLFTRNPHS